MSKKILFLILIAIVLLPGLVSAASISIPSMVAAIQQTVFFVASAITVILWVTTGLLFLMAQGDPAKLTKAKGALFTSIAGTLIVIIAGSAIALVGQAFGM